jgi:cytochrome c-type biogenesis protein CcmH/NrfG
VGLAVAFVLGFVLLGVGSGSNGISDAFQNAFHFGSSGTSVSKLEKKTEQHPKDAQAWRDLATAYEQKSRTQDAVRALQQYSALRPKDQDALGELASQYTTLAQQYYTDYANAQSSGVAAPTSFLTGTLATALSDPIAQASQTQTSTAVSAAQSKYTGALSDAEAAYRKLATRNPTDASTQYLLGQTAQAAGDYKGAVKAYTRFLKLAPSDTSAPQVRQLLKQVKAYAGLSSSTSSSR